MRGYAIPIPKYLNSSEIGFLNSVYCGLCHTLRYEFGTLAAFLHNYDAQFLSLLAITQNNAQLNLTTTKCPLGGYIKKQNIVSDSNALKYGAASTVILLEEKLIDDIHDERKMQNSIIISSLNKQIKHAKRIFQEFGFPEVKLKEAEEAQRQIEVQKNISLYNYLEPTGSILGEIFLHTEIISQKYDNGLLLRDLGSTVGKIIALSDACEDLSSDRKKGISNPIISAWNLDNSNMVPFEIMIKVCDLMLDYFFQTRTIVSQLSFNHFPTVIHNIVSRGFTSRALVSLKKLWIYNHWSGRIDKGFFRQHYFNSCNVCGFDHIPPKNNNVFPESGMKDIWVLASIFPTAHEIASELGYSNRGEYLFSCLLPSFKNGS